jgi:hypothetical protein
MCPIHFTRLEEKKTFKKNRINFLALLHLRSDLDLHGTIMSLCK